VEELSDLERSVLKELIGDSSKTFADIARTWV